MTNQQICDRIIHELACLTTEQVRTIRNHCQTHLANRDTPEREAELLGPTLADTLRASIERERGQSDSSAEPEDPERWDAMG